MKLLLDTHTFLWADHDPTKLSDQARALLSDPAHERLLSVASLWEMQIKSMLGKLTLRLPLPELIREHESVNSLIVLAVTSRHVFDLTALPSIHGDPFDRLLAAQTLELGWSLLSKDTVFDAYGVRRLWS